MLLRFLNFIGLSGLMFLIALTPGRIFAQHAIDKTTLGQSQNDGRDLVNSLVPGEKKYGKGEKKEQVNSADLKSKKEKDTTFGGSLLNMGIVGVEPKLDESKRRVVESEKDNSTAKQSAVNQMGPMLQLSDSAALQQQAEQSDITVGGQEPKATARSSAAAGDTETQTKQQTANAEQSKDQKPSTASSEKSSTSKPDGDH